MVTDRFLAWFAAARKPENKHAARRRTVMKRKELYQWTLAVMLVGAAFAILKWGPSVPSATAAEGGRSMAAESECV